jgi:hypothetical protein
VYTDGLGPAAVVDGQVAPTSATTADNPRAQPAQLGSRSGQAPNCERNPAGVGQAAHWTRSLLRGRAVHDGP